MIPIRSLQPIQKRSYVTYGLILVNLLVFAWEITVPPAQLNQFFYHLAVVPCQLGNNFFSFDTLLDMLRTLFYHAGWAHVSGNMVFLWIFGRNVEDYFGHARYLLLYLAWGFIAALAQAVVSPWLCAPLVGASGAIAGVLGSYLVLYPGSRVRILDFFLLFPRISNIPAYVMLGFWFLLQLLDGIAALNIDAAVGGIAFWAHIGGFIAGFVVTFIFTMFRRPPEVQVYTN